MKKTLALFLLFSTPAVPAPRWLRHLGAAAVCSVSALDLATTAYGTSHGYHEGNPLLSSSGTLRVGRTVGVNLGLCAAAVVASELRRVPDYVALPLDAGLTVPKMAAVVHNFRQLGGK